MRTARIISIVTLTLTVGLGCWFELMGPNLNQQLANATPFKAGLKLKDFSLRDTQGHLFQQADFKKHWTLVFFGYRQCPDVCPASLSLVREAFKIVDNQLFKPDLRFLFVNLIPAPDEPKSLQAYVHNFNPKFEAVTGSKAEIQKMMAGFGAFTLGKSDAENIEHSGHLFLINPEGQLAALMSPPFKARELAHDLLLLVPHKKKAHSKV